MKLAMKLLMIINNCEGDDYYDHVDHADLCSTLQYNALVVGRTNGNGFRQKLGPKTESILSMPHPQKITKSVQKAKLSPKFHTGHDIQNGKAAKRDLSATRRIARTNPKLEQSLLLKTMPKRIRHKFQSLYGR